MSNQYQRRDNDKKPDNPINSTNEVEYLKIYSGKPENIDKVLNEIQKKLVGKYLKFVSTSQMRNIYHKIIQTQNFQELKLLRPNLYYLIARLDKKDAKEGIKKISSIIEKNVNNKDDLIAFKQFMETVIAYHKFYSKN